MKKQLFIAGAILLAFVSVAAVLIALRSAPPERPRQAQAPLVQTTPADVRSGALTVEGAGTVQALDEVVLAAEIAGKLVYVNPGLVAGGTVRRGDVLLRIDPSDYQNAVEQARADVAQQEVTVLQAEEEAAIARAEYERFSDREARRGLGPYASVDADDYAARILPPNERVRRSGETADSIRAPSSLTLREPQRQAAAAALARARAQLSDAERALERTVVRAPFSGSVRSESVALGSYVSPGQSLAQIVASEAVEVVVPLTRDEAALLPDLWSRTGRIPATVTTDYGGLRYAWKGYVDRANAVLNPETRTIDVVVRVPSPIAGGRAVADTSGAGSETAALVPDQAPPLFVGEFVQVALQGAPLDRYVALPRTALRPGDDVWVVRDSTLRIVPVAVIHRIDEVAYVFADQIRAGEPIITSDLPIATDGMRVRIPDTARTSGAMGSQPSRLSETS